MQIFYPNYCSVSDLPSWEELLSELDNSINENKFKDLPRMGFVTHNGERIEKVETLRKQIHDSRPEEKICTAHLYMSLLPSSGTFGRHKDDTDVFFILAQGKMRWIVEAEETVDIEMKAGDMIFLPKEVYHTPIPLTSRVGISIGFT